MAYIYINGDREKPYRSKVGKTTRSVKERTSETTNPDYFNYHSYKVADAQLDSIEKQAHAAIKRAGHKCVLHHSTKKPSEWFECTPEQADEIIAQLFKDEASKIEASRQRQKLSALRINTIDYFEKSSKLYELQTAVHDYHEKAREVEASLHRKYEKKIIKSEAWFSNNKFVLLFWGGILGGMYTSYDLDLLVALALGYAIVVALGFTSGEAFEVGYDYESVKRDMLDWRESNSTEHRWNADMLQAVVKHREKLMAHDYTKPIPVFYPPEHLIRPS